MITFFNRFGLHTRIASILRKMSKHVAEENCEVCQQEETKSPSLKISGTRILERVILPLNECWICDLKFEDSEGQVNHFAEHHECEFCGEYCDTLQEKRKHVLDKHECPICGKHFEKVLQKIYHLSGDHGLLKCEYCEKYFQSVSEVVDHTSTDHFKCRFCKYNHFGSLQKTREHVLAEHECQICGKYDYSKKYHMEEHHQN